MSDPEPSTSSGSHPGGGTATSVVARVAGGLLLVGAALSVLWTFVTPLIWAGIVAWVTWPAYQRLRERLGRPALSAALLTLAIGLGIGIPLVLLVAALAGDAASMLAWLRDWHAAGAPLPDWIADNRWFQEIQSRITPEAVGGQRGAVGAMAGVLAGLSKTLVTVAGRIAANAMLFSVMLVAVYTLYVNGERIAEVGRNLFHQFFPTAPDRFYESVGDAVQAVVIGLLGTATIQGILAGIGLAVAGVPSATFLGAATAVLSFLPGGATAPSVLAAVWLYLSGSTPAAIGLLLWGVLVVGMIDNVVRPLLIGGRSEIPFILIFLGVVGGLSTFGLLGLFLGPVLLSVSFTLVAQYADLSEPPR